jgi:hypothetical protein
MHGWRVLHAACTLVVFSPTVEPEKVLHKPCWRFELLLRRVPQPLAELHRIAFRLYGPWKPANVERKVRLAELSKRCRPAEVGNFNQEFGFIAHKFVGSSRDSVI